MQFIVCAHHWNLVASITDWFYGAQIAIFCVSGVFRCVCLCSKIVVRYCHSIILTAQYVRRGNTSSETIHNSQFANRTVCNGTPTIDSMHAKLFGLFECKCLVGGSKIHFGARVRTQNFSQRFYSFPCLIHQREYWNTANHTYLNECTSFYANLIIDNFSLRRQWRADQRSSAYRKKKTARWVRD